MHGRLVPAQTHMNLNTAVIIIAIITTIITFMSTDSEKASVGWLESLIICAGTGVVHNVQALIKNPL